MLYEFYSTQTTKKPGSVHATYLLDGVSRPVRESSVNRHQQDGGDMHVQSSPYMSSSIPHQEDQEDAFVPRSIVLAKEEDVEGKMNMRIRRTGKRPPIGAHSIPTETFEEKASSRPQGFSREQRNVVKSSGRPSPSDKSTRSTFQAAVTPDIKADRPRDVENKPAGKPVVVKRDQSDIFKSFSKPKAKLKHEDTGSSTGASLAPNRAHSEAKSVQEDEPMKDASEDEQNEDFMASNCANPRTSKSQSERAEQLRKMMEDEDEEMEDTVDGAQQISQHKESVDAPTSQKESSPEPPVVVNGGRRRGRRNVLKKKTIKDEEGYLVTKEEPAWESFSEEESPPQKQKTPASTSTSSMGKGKKLGGKPGQGNIMSFFGKK
ncbi:MAG: hypothetical protein Q9175_006970 [Cornicularia normoerica]